WQKLAAWPLQVTSLLALWAAQCRSSTDNPRIIQVILYAAVEPFWLCAPLKGNFGLFQPVSYRPKFVSSD
ncbi:hypothetical protein P3406_24035, partial [Vibrio parahaemolyticus]|nr:hypothetical protein [Vibrio parahaemolyticus]